MKGDEKHVWVIIELLLRSIAMMYIPIENTDFFALSLRQARCYSDIIKYAEAGRL